jgi:ribosomal protein S18 acetylase RimI-like enzyme
MASTYVRVMSRLGQQAGLRVFRVFGRRLRARVGAPASRLDCRLLKEREVLALCADAALDLVPSKVQAAYARGDLCVGAYQDGKLAGYCWFALSAAPHMDGAWLEFPEHVVYIYKSYVRPAFRGRGIAATLYGFADALFLQRGRTHAVLCVESHNRPSIAAARRSGFADAGYAAYLGGARLRAWCSRAAAGSGLRFFIPE